MKVGLSTYSLSRAVKAGEMDVLQVLEWIAENGGEHVEIVPIPFTLTDNDQLVKDIVAKAANLGLDISSYTIGANFLQETDEKYRAEIDRIIKEVDIAAALGVKLMRHDAGSRPPADATAEQFEKDLPKLADACREIAAYATKFGITTSVENHGFHVQHNERVRRLVDAVGLDNFKTTLDIGNFICVDDDPLTAAQNNAPYASMVHAKDFYLRGKSNNPGEGFVKTPGGNFRRGAIVGHGDIDVRGAFKALKAAGYDGYLSVEFEGMEDCRTGSRIGMDNTRRLWQEA